MCNGNELSYLRWIINCFRMDLINLIFVLMCTSNLMWALYLEQLGFFLLPTFNRIRRFARLLFRDFLTFNCVYLWNSKSPWLKCYWNNQYLFFCNIKLSDISFFKSMPLNSLFDRVQYFYLTILPIHCHNHSLSPFLQPIT